MKLAGFADEAGADIKTQAAVLAELGWDSLEIRAVDGKNISELNENEVLRIHDFLTEKKIHVCSLGSTIANWGQSVAKPFEETVENLNWTIKYMEILKTSMVRIMSYAVELDGKGRALPDQMEGERFKRLKYICEKFTDSGITPVHENCLNYGGMSWEHTLRLIEKVPGLKLVYDTGNPPLTPDFRKTFPYPMQDSWEFYDHVKDHIAHMHIKDSYFESESGEEIYTFPGEGAGDVLKIVTDLLRRGYDGTFSIEPHMAVVFHKTSVKSDAKTRYDNFITYGKKWEDLLKRAAGNAERRL